jgi:hypothetical protein
MNAKLRQIDLQAEILTSLYDNGRIGEARYLKAIRRLTERAAAILEVIAGR